MLLFLLCREACSSSCPVLDCWFVQERVGRGGGLTAPTTQEKSLLHISRRSQSVEPSGIPSDINPEKVFYVTGEQPEQPNNNNNNVTYCTVY